MAERRDITSFQGRRDLYKSDLNRTQHLAALPSKELLPRRVERLTKISGLQQLSETAKFGADVQEVKNRLLTNAVPTITRRIANLESEEARKSIESIRLNPDIPVDIREAAERTFKELFGSSDAESAATRQPATGLKPETSGLSSAEIDQVLPTIKINIQDRTFGSDEQKRQVRSHAKFWDVLIKLARKGSMSAEQIQKFKPGYYPADTVTPLRRALSTVFPQDEIIKTEGSHLHAIYKLNANVEFEGLFDLSPFDVGSLSGKEKKVLEELMFATKDTPATSVDLLDVAYNGARTPEAVKRLSVLVSKLRARLKTNGINISNLNPPGSHKSGQYYLERVVQSEDADLPADLSGQDGLSEDSDEEGEEFYRPVSRGQTYLEKVPTVPASRLQALSAYLSGEAALADIIKILGPAKNGRTLTWPQTLSSMRHSINKLLFRSVSGLATPEEIGVWNEVKARYPEIQDAKEAARLFREDVDKWVRNAVATATGQEPQMSGEEEVKGLVQTIVEEDVTSEIGTGGSDWVLSRPEMSAFLQYASEDTRQLVEKFVRSEYSAGVITAIRDKMPESQSDVKEFMQSLSGVIFEHLGYWYETDKYALRKDLVVLSPSDVHTLYSSMYRDADTASDDQHIINQAIRGISYPDGLIIRITDSELSIDAIIDYKMWSRNRADSDKNERQMEKYKYENFVVDFMRSVGSDPLFHSRILSELRSEIPLLPLIVNPDLGIIYGLPKNSEVELPPHISKDLIPIDSRVFGVLMDNLVDVAKHSQEAINANAAPDALAPGSSMAQPAAALAAETNQGTESQKTPPDIAVFRAVVEGLNRHSRLWLDRLLREVVDSMPEENILSTAAGKKIRITSKDVYSYFVHGLNKMIKEHEAGVEWTDADKKVWDDYIYKQNELAGGNLSRYKDKIRAELNIAQYDYFQGRADNGGWIDL